MVAADARAPLHRNGYALVAASGLTSLLGLLFWLVAARGYAADAVGTQAALISAMILLAGLGQLSLGTVLVRFLPVAGAATLRLVIGVYAIAAAAAAAAALLFAIGTPVWSPALEFLRTDRWWLLAFVGSTALWSTFALQDAVLTGTRQAIWVPLENTVVSVAKILLLGVLAVTLPAAGIFASWMLPTAFVVVIVNVLVVRSLLPAHARRSLAVARPMHPGGIARYAAGNYAGTVFLLATTSLLPVLVVGRLGAVSTAHFAIPWAIATALQLLPLSLGQSLTVETVLDVERLRANCRAVLARTFLLLLPSVALLLGVAPYLLKLFGADYAEAGTPLLRWLAVGAIPGAVVAIGLSAARALDRTMLVAATQGLVCVILLSLSFALMPTRGIEAVGISMLVSQIAAALVVSATVLRDVLLPEKHR